MFRSISRFSSSSSFAKFPKMAPMHYPHVRRDTTVVEQLHGTTIHDPYRWLEEPDSEETKRFVEEQNSITSGILAQYKHREDLRQRLTDIFDYEKFGCPFRRGSYYYYFCNSGLQPQSVLYRQPVDQATSTQGTVFFDPNTLSTDGTAALSTYAFTDSGSYFAYGVSFSGSDWVTIHVQDESGKKMSDEIKWAKFTSISWTKDEKGFFYSRYPPPAENVDAGTETSANYNGMLYYHRLGTLQSEDVLVHKDPDHPTHMFSTDVTDDGRYVIVSTSESCDPVNKLALIDLAAYPQGLPSSPKMMTLVDNFDAGYSYITNDDSVFFFKTNAKAPRYKIAKIDLKNVSAGFVDVVPESEHVLEYTSCVDATNLILVYQKDVKHVVSLHTLPTGKFVETLPVEIGSIDSLTGRKQDKEMFFKLSSFLNPGVTYNYKFGDKKLTVFRTTKLKAKGLSTDDYETKQVFFPSKDGTKIPMFLIHKKGLKLDGNNPTLLYAYGGFSISITPMFSPAWLAFVRHFDGVVAVANIRGGGEYGEDWHKAGSLHKKQNCFDDFQFAARWLEANGYTKPEKYVSL
jgi:prolyl oligopeptidase